MNRSKKGKVSKRTLQRRAKAARSIKVAARRQRILHKLDRKLDEVFPRQEFVVGSEMPPEPASKDYLDAQLDAIRRELGGRREAGWRADDEQQHPPITGEAHATYEGVERDSAVWEWFRHNDIGLDETSHHGAAASHFTASDRDKRLELRKYALGQAVRLVLGQPP